MIVKKLKGSELGSEEVGSHLRKVNDLGFRQPEIFNPKKLENIHNKSKYGSHSDLRDLISADGLLHGEFNESIDSVLNECEFKVSDTQKPHPIVSTCTPVLTKQTDIACDVIFFEGNSF